MRDMPFNIGRVVTPKGRAWLAAVICAACLDPVASRSWTCSLGYLPVENIPLTPSQQELLRKNSEENGPLRARRLEHHAIALPRDYVERRARADTFDGSNVTLPEDEVYQEGRPCPCAAGLYFNDDTAYYCPTPTDYCSVWRHRWTHDHQVTCYQDTDWRIGFARNVWYYLCFALLICALYPFFTSPGQHAVRYLLSQCFPRLNIWITEQLLQAEMEARNLVRDEFEYAARLERRTEGWISGYSLKTKCYSRSEDDKAGVVDCERDMSEDECIEDDVAAREPAHDDVHDLENEDSMCTICLLAVEDGERVADLSCGHLYHADCLGEWILKKNACPLCQNPEIANEIRTFETDDDFEEGGDASSSESMLVRLRRALHSKCLDIATGRRQWIHVHSHHAMLHRIRMARQSDIDT